MADWRGSGRDRCEPLAVFGWRDTDMPRKGGAERVGLGKAAMGGALLRHFVADLEQPPGGADAGFLDPGGRRDPDLASKQACEVARAQVHAFCEIGDAVIERRIGGDPALQFLQRRVTSRNHFALAAELNLPTRTITAHYQRAYNTLSN